LRLDSDFPPPHMTILSLRLLRTKSPIKAMALGRPLAQSRVVSGQRNKSKMARHMLKEK